MAALTTVAPKNPTIACCDASGWSVVKMWLAWASITSFAPGILPAINSPFPGGTSSRSRRGSPALAL